MRTTLEEDFEDLVENVLTKLYMRYKSLKIEKILPYAYRAMENEIKDYWKKKSRDKMLFSEQQDQLNELPENDRSIEDTVINQDLLNNIRTALNKLGSAKKKMIFQLKLQGYDSQEIMTKLHLSRSAYDTIVFRATQDIKKYLQKQEVTG